MYSKVLNTPLKMKEDVMVLQVSEEFSGSFNELSCSEDIDEESNCGGILLFKMFINVCSILDVKTGSLNKGLVFYLI